MGLMMILVAAVVLLVVVAGIAIAAATMRGKPAPGARSVGPAADGPVDASQDPEVRRFLQQDQKIRAIARVRELTGLDLKEAKAYVEALADAKPVPPSVPTGTGATADADLARAAREWVASEGKIGAIKRVRERTGWGLKEAKDYVEKAL